MAISRLNYTNRRKLELDQARIALRRDGGTVAFDADLSLPPELPPGAKVFVEAYHQATRMRFDFGLAAAPTPPPLDQRRLTEFADPELVLFRVKVTNMAGSPGRLLAAAFRIRPAALDDPQGRRGLLRTKNKPLDGPVWELEFDDSGPLLCVDPAAGSHHEVGRQPAFAALVYPEVLRQTLARIIYVEQDVEDDEERWCAQWVKFARDLGVHELPARWQEMKRDEDDDEVVEWINAVVRAFASRHQACRAFNPPADGEGI